MIRANDKGLTPPPAVVEGGSARRINLSLTPRNLVILVGVVAWLAFLMLFVVPQVFGKKAAPAEGAAKTAQVEASAPAGEAAAAATTAIQPGVGGVTGPKAVPAPSLTLQDRVINLSGSTGYKYVKFTMVVQFTDEKGQFAKAKGEAIKKLQDAFAAENTGTVNTFNDILTLTVSSKTAAELATPQGKEALRSELINKFNQALAGQGRVTYINFTDFVMQ